MADLDFIAFFFQTMLDEEFKTKTNMAKLLDVTHRTLQYNFQKLGNEKQKGGCLACQNLLLYCCRNNISIDNLYHRFLSNQKGKEKRINGVQHPLWQIDTFHISTKTYDKREEITLENTGLLQWIYHQVLQSQMNSDIRSMAVELRLPESVLENALQNDNSMEYTLLFEQLLAYCARNGISVDAILREYVGG